MTQLKGALCAGVHKGNHEDEEEEEEDKEEDDDKDRDEEAEDVEEQEDQRYRSDPYRSDQYRTEPRTIALQMMVNAGIRKEDGALALAAVPENPGNTETCASIRHLLCQQIPGACYRSVNWEDPHMA